MQRNEKDANFFDASRAVTENALLNTWTALPCIVQSVDLERQTLECAPAVQGVQVKKDGTQSFENMPMLVDVPICFPKCADFALTMPIKAGDEVLVVFSSRCIDSWWQNGGEGNPPAENRRHDLSDGFAILAPTSQPKKLANVSAENVQLRNTAGDVFLEITTGGNCHVVCQELQVETKGNAVFDVGGDIELKAGGSFNATAGGEFKAKGSQATIDCLTTINGNLQLNGGITQAAGGGASGGEGGNYAKFNGTIETTQNLVANGDVSAGGDVKAGGVSLKQHTHGGVYPGSNNTTPPN